MLPSPAETIIEEKMNIVQTEDHQLFKKFGFAHQDTSWSTETAKRPENVKWEGAIASDIYNHSELWTRSW